MPKTQKSPLEIVQAEINVLSTRIGLAKIGLHFMELHLKEVMEKKRAIEALI